jgi:hypothetical protein
VRRLEQYSKRSCKTMTELDFFKWVNENQPEYRWDSNLASNKEDVILWINFYHIKSFMQLLSAPGLFDEGGIEVRLQQDAIAIWASDVLDYFGIELEKIFDKN